MSSIALSPAADPFAEVLTKLKNSLEVVRPILAPINEVQTICVDVDQALDYAADIPATLTVCSETLELLSGLCEALIEIPYVDIVAEVAAGIFEDVAVFLGDVQTAIKGVIDDIVTPCKKLFDDLAKAMKEAAKVLHTIGTTIPDYLNTVQILDYCLDIAKQLVPVLSGTNAEQSTQKFVEGMIGIRDELTKVLSPLATFTQDLAAVVDDITKALGSAFSDIEGVLETVKNGLGKFESIVDPIKHAFQAIENAIAPIKWVLDAVESVIKAVLEPVIHAILEATGLDALMKPLLAELEKALGVEPLFKALDQNVQPTSSTQWQSKAGSTSVSKGSQAWSEVVAELKQYDTRDKGNTYKLVVDLVDAITGSPVGPGPFPIPDWPIPPKPGGLGGQAKSSRPEALVGREVAHAVRASRLEDGFSALQRMAVPGDKARLAAAAAPTLWVTDELAKAKVIKASYDDVGLPHVTKLLQAAQVAKQSLAEAQQIGPELAGKLVLFDQARQLPADFEEEMEDFASLFADSVEVIDFLLGFSWVPKLLSQLETPLKNQADEAGKVYGEAQALVQASQGVDQTVAVVEAAVPSKQAFSQALHYIDQVAAGAASLGNVVRRGLALDVKLQGQFAPRISAMQQQIDTDAAAALGQMTQIHTSASDAIKQAQAISTFLTSYAAKFAKVGTDAGSVSAKALPGLRKGVQVCNTIASILDPLSGILEDLDCKAKSNSLVKGANAEVEVFKKGMKSKIGGQSSTLNDAFDFVLNELVPSGEIYADLQDLNTFVAQQEKGFENTAHTLETDFLALATAMKPRKSFPYKATVSFKHDPPPSIQNGKPVGGGKAVTKQVDQTVGNFFVDAAFKAKMLELVNDMNQQASKAGLANPGND